MATPPALTNKLPEVFFFRDSPGFFNRTMDEHDVNLHVEGSTRGRAGNASLTDEYWLAGHAPITHFPIWQDWNDDISSIRVISGHATVYEHVNYNEGHSGFAVTLGPGFYEDQDLERLGVHSDAISSYILW